MRKFLPPAALAAALLASTVAIDVLATPAVAQEVSFDTFHDQLAQYGAWVYSDRWGEVWMPFDVSYNFRPYDTNGHWVYTEDYGWYWASDYPWGDIAFHYGRWVNDPYDGWLWIPGYEWSPAWVMWRRNDRYVGWMPMPPDRRFLGSSGVNVGLNFGNGFALSFNFGSSNDYYGYRQWYGRDYDENRFAANWVFVGSDHMADRDFHRYSAPQNTYVNIIHNTTNITNYTVVNNYVVNKGIDPRSVGQGGGRPVQVVRAAEVIKRPEFVMRADQGQQIQARMREERPRGTGLANSAPKPSDAVVQSLSTNVTPRNGQQSTHLFTRQTIVNAPLPTKPGGRVPGGMMGSPANTLQGPNTMQGPNGMQGPNTMGGPNTTTQERRMHERTAPSDVGGPPSMTGPSNQNPSTMTGPTNTMQSPTNTMERRTHERTQPETGGTPSMTGPSNTMQSPNSTMQERRMHTPPSDVGGPPSMTGPSNTMQSPNTMMQERRTRERPPSDVGGPPSMTGPSNTMQSPNTMMQERRVHTPPSETGAAPSTQLPPPARNTMMRQAPVQQTPPPPPNKGEEKDKKDKHPPG